MIIWIDHRPDLGGNPLAVRAEQWINGEPYGVIFLLDQPVKLAEIPWNIIDSCYRRLAYQVFEEGLGYPKGGAGFEYEAETHS